MSDDRLTLLNGFLKQNGWDDAERGLLASDASFRHYDRLKRANGETAVLMDAPPPMEDVRPFVNIDLHLEKLGFSAPHIMAQDKANGFVLLEDFGDDTYTRLLKKGADETELYALATDFLVALHSLPEKQAVPAGLPLYNENPLRNEVMLFPDWYMPAVFGMETDKKAADEFVLLWEELFALTFKVPQTLVLRDYHIDNLMRLEGREGVKACGLLDFQDALNGAITYDIMSLLEDARRDISPELFAQMQARYIDGMGEHLGDKEDFLTSWAVLAAQRHTKVLGIFVRLCVRDKKPVYLQHIPRLWRLLENSLNHPVLRRLKEWFDANVPEEYRKIPSCVKE